MDDDDDLRRVVAMQDQRIEQQERESRLLAERTNRLEEMAQKVNYALFGLQGNNGLIGALDKVGTSLRNVNDRIDEKETKDDARWNAKEEADRTRWTNLQWRFVAGMGAVILLLLTVLGAVLTQQ